jgi:ankyrin repeat protein
MKFTYYASSYNNIAAVRHLIEKGGAVDKVNAWGYQPLHLCVPKGYFKLEEILIDKGGSSDVNAQNRADEISIRIVTQSTN